MSLTIDITRANGFDLFIGEDKLLVFPLYDEEVTSALWERYRAVKQQARDEGPATPTAVLAEIVTLESYLQTHQIDPTGSDFDFIVRKSDKAADPPLIFKTTGSPGGVAVTGSPAVVEVNLYDIDTALADGSGVVLKPGDYRYSLKRVDAGAETITAEGVFQLSEATAR
jgi:hypothetical protein